MSAPSQKSAILTLSANGSIGKAGESTTNWTSKEDLEWFKAVTKAVGAVVVGHNTYKTIGFPLPGRMNYVITRDPSLIDAVPGKLMALTLEQFQALKLSAYCVIGGMQIWKALEREIEVLYLSRHKHVIVEGEAFDLDMRKKVLFSRTELAEITKEIYTQPSYFHPEIALSYDDNQFMEAAEQFAATDSLDKNHPTGAALVKDGEILALGANGSRWHEEHMNDPELKDFAGCRRKLLGCPSGTGYEHCEGCSNANHAEVRAIRKAIENGFNPSGSTCYLWGHWWCCEPCATALVAAGIKQVVASRKWTKEFLGIVTD